MKQSVIKSYKITEIDIGYLIHNRIQDKIQSLWNDNIDINTIYISNKTKQTLLKYYQSVAQEMEDVTKIILDSNEIDIIVDDSMNYMEYDLSEQVIN